jgi:hypothetical protein
MPGVRQAKRVGYSFRFWADRYRVARQAGQIVRAAREARAGSKQAGKPEEQAQDKQGKELGYAWKSSLLSTKRSTSKVYGVEEPASYRYTWITISVKPGPSVYIDIFTVYSFPFCFIFLSKIASGCTSYSPSFPTIGMSDRTCTPSPTLFFNCETLKTGCTSF